MIDLKRGAYIRAITPGNTPLGDALTAVYVGTNGTVDITNSDGTTANGVGVVAGSILDVPIHKITAATATVYGLYSR
jgi:hypothetical protein